MKNNWADKLTIADLRVPTVIGVHAHERTAPQTLFITVTLPVLLDKATQTDSIADVLDYTQIRQTILDFAKQSSYQLLEAFTSHLADHLKKQFCLSWLQLSVTKTPVDMPDIRGITLMIER